MYLKWLEVQGFKSFSEKIRLDFNQGVTAVVGPNGSGKSNIADAVRWVLGEQSAKSLRGARMEDVIFAGTENRRPLGFAEVSLVVDNADRRIPIEYGEIKITRKVYRSGESEYMLNGSACRLKDIHELFMDTGVGREGYAIIGQGRVEEILSARSEDRRYLFEEAAGIVKYRSRKTEAQAKLERQRQNLVRVSDVIDLLAGQLEPLAAQAEKARQYLDKRERLKSLSVNLFLLETGKTERELKVIGENTENLLAQIETESERRRSLGEAVSGLKEQSARIDADTKEANARAAELRSRAEQRENDIKFTQAQAQTAALSAGRLEGELGRAREAVLNLTDARERNDGKLRGLAQELALKTGELEAKRAEFAALDEKMSGAARRIEEFNEGLIKGARREAEAKAELERLRADYERLEERKEGLGEDSAENDSQAAEKGARLLELQEALAELEALADEVAREQLALESEKAQTSAALRDISARHVSVSRELNDAASRHKALSDLEKNHEGYYKSVKAVLSKKKDDPAGFAGICGAVGELLETDAAYETAVDVALGSAVQHVVTITEEDARTAIEYLKRASAGRATFLPLSAAKPRGMSKTEKDAALKEPGVLGVAGDMVRYDAAYENVFQGLLGRVLVVDGMDNAIPLYRKLRYAYKIVTLEGELLNVGGAMTGGSAGHKTPSLFGRGREIRELAGVMAAKGGEAGALEAELQKQNAQLRLIKDKLIENNALLHEKALERVTLAENITQAESALDAMRRRKEALEAEDGLVMDKLAEINAAIRRVEEDKARAEEQTEALRDDLARFQGEAVADRQAKEERNRALTALQVEISAGRQNMAAAEAEHSRIQAEIESGGAQARRILSEMEENRAQAREKEAEIAALTAGAEDILAEQGKVAAALAELDDRKDDTLEKLAIAEREEKAAAELLFDLQNERTRLELLAEQAEAGRRKLYDDLWDEYGLTMQGALAYESDKALNEGQQDEVSFERMKREERRLKAELAQMGGVNVDAIEEYKQVRRRHDDMSAQREDILEAEEKLNGLIAELTALMEARFREQFALISQSFSTVFRQMFGGGKAYLELADEDNALESGIDIVAQPPGKTLQSMSLLSGGERALTATALLFGILQMKPSPFCLLDEVEAALDDANVARYANFIKNFVHDTQFILITHRKATMEAADVLYGVTMQELGVSKLVSVSFEEAG